MDWKYMHVNRQAMFNAPPERVIVAADALKADCFDDWRIYTTTDGFMTKGFSAGHAATATFRIAPVAGGTQVAVELLVRRASPEGFMLLDRGGYYDGEVRKWLAGIGRHLMAPGSPPSS